MIVTTTNEIAGRKVVKTFGIVKGNAIRTRHLGKDILAGLRNIIGSALVEYEDMLSETREVAQKRMEEEAEKLGADAVVCARFATSQVMQGAAELVAYGTAVKLA